jgi:hypothetical protein
LLSMYKLGLDASTCKISKTGPMSLCVLVFGMCLYYSILAYHSNDHTFKQLYMFLPKYVLVHSPHNYFTYSCISSVLLFSCFPWALFSLLKYPSTYMTFRGPCIVIYSYNKTNEMH